jgi:hypothetical protein
VKSLVDSLWHETRGRFERLPVWLPGTPMSLGDVGVFDESGWVKHTTLDVLGVRFSSDTAGEPVNYDYSSHDGAEVSMRLAASGVPALDAVTVGNIGMHIRFSRQGAFVLKANTVTVRRIADLAKIDEQILEQYRKRRWQPGWVLVSEVAQGGPSITIVSGSKEGEAVIDLGTTAAATGGPLIGAGFGMRSTKGLAASFITPTEATLLWRGRCVYDRWWLSQPRLNDRCTDVRGDADVGHDHAGGSIPQVVEVEHPEDLPATPSSAPPS